MILFIMFSIVSLVLWFTWRNNRVVSYLEGRVIDIDTGDWSLNSDSPSTEAVSVTVMFKDRSTANIKAITGRVYSLGDILIIKKVLFFKKYIFYTEVV